MGFTSGKWTEPRRDDIEKALRELHSAFLSLWQFYPSGVGFSKSFIFSLGNTGKKNTGKM